MATESLPAPRFNLSARSLKSNYIDYESFTDVTFNTKMEAATLMYC